MTALVWGLLQYRVLVGLGVVALCALWVRETFEDSNPYDER